MKRSNGWFADLTGCWPSPAGVSRMAGFSLIELMIALVLGLLLSIGLVTLFGATSKTNRVQDSMARIQENGRYALTRISDDLRMMSAQYCNNSGGRPVMTANGQQIPARAPSLFVQNFNFPDAATTPTSLSTTATVSLSPRYFMQGYECGTSGCAPNTVPTALPGTGTTAGKRVPGSDVLTVRYQRGNGWAVSGCSASNAALTAEVGAGDASTTPPVPADPPLNFGAGDIALVSDCINPQIFKVSVSGTTLTPSNLTTGASPGCPADIGSTDVRVFNLSKDFMTITYYLKLKADTSPGATAGRLIPVLMRRESSGAAGATINEQELVEGVERLDFLYGVEDNNGAVRYLKADKVTSGTNCPPLPVGLTAAEAGCMWRGVKSVEVHLLLNSINDIRDLSNPDMAYRYSDGSTATTDPAPPSGTTMPITGLASGRMMRREFNALISARNYTP